MFWGSFSFSGTGSLKPIEDITYSANALAQLKEKSLQI